MLKQYPLDGCRLSENSWHLLKNEDIIDNLEKGTNTVLKLLNP